MLIDPVVLLIATQIIIESFPISSAGHMALAEYALSRLNLGALPVLPDYFDHFLHGPALIVLMVYFYHDWWPLLKGLWAGAVAWVRAGFKAKGLSTRQQRLMTMIGTFVILGFLADLVTALFYFSTRFWYKDAAFLHGLPMLVVGFVVTGLVLMSTRWAPVRANATFTLPRALVLGLVQGMALFPGSSRFAYTVVAARWLGFSPRKALHVSFMMFFPLMVAAFFINGLPAMIMHAQGRALLQPAWLLTYALLTAISYAGFKLSCAMFLRETIWKLGWYMMLPALLALSLAFF